MSNELQSEFSAQHSVKIHAQTRVYDGFFKLDKYSLQFKRYDGKWSSLLEREIFERGQAAGVLLHDPEQQKVVLVEQFRPGALKYNEGHSPWLIEIVAGMVETNLSVEDTIYKESIEETGLQPFDLIKICEFYPSPGGSTEKLHLYYAKVCAKNAGGIFGNPQEYENIRVIVLDLNQAFDAIESGRINNAMTIIALQWLKINQKSLS